MHPPLTLYANHAYIPTSITNTHDNKYPKTSEFYCGAARFGAKEPGGTKVETLMRVWCDPQSVVNALRANMHSEKLVPAGAVYHLHTVGAKTAPGPLRGMPRRYAGQFQCPQKVNSWV